MSQNLYIESIAEARQLREIAEANARNKIIDAITPQIRKLIEKKLLSDEDEIESSEESELIDIDSDAGEEAGELAEPSDDMPNPRTTNIEDFEDEDEMGELEHDENDVSVTPTSSGAQINVKDDGNISLTLDDVEIIVNQKSKTFEGLEDRATSRSSLKSATQRAKIFEMKYKLFNIMLEKEIKNGLGINEKKKFVQILETLQKQAAKIKSDAILTEGSSKIINKMNNLIKEMKMSRKRVNNNVFDFLFEMAEEDGMPVEGMHEEDEMPVEESLEEADEKDEGEGEPDVDRAMAALEDAIAALKGEGGDEGEDDMGDLGDLGGKGDDDAAAPRDDDREDEEKNESQTYEIDESVLRRELRRMKRLSEVTSGVSDPKFTARAFGGGDVEDEMFIDVDEETLLNVLADELGRVKFKGGRMHESPARRAVSPRRNNETAALHSKLREYETMTESMKAQLVEMNLFNAKLLYANKLMQNKNLTQKQQRAIVEALDNAKTLREAKLLYKSLTESLNKGSARSLQEGSTRTLGSSSRSTQSAQVRPTSSGVEVDRWAVLAGIASKK
jgi:hypothetical protein